jgi:CSLREA domain-containing protein
MNRRFVRLLPFASLLAFSAAAEAATFTVTTTTDLPGATCGATCSLRQAINAANANGGTDTITIPAGTYTLTLTGTESPDTGDLDITDAVTLNGAGSGATIIQAGTTGSNGIGRVLDIHTAGGTTNINNLTLRYGKLAAAGSTVPDGSFGGALLWAAFYGSDALTLTNVVISDSNNAVGDGGGLAFVTNGAQVTATLSNVTVNNNVAAAGHGGGIFAGCDVRFAISGSSITGNTATFGTRSYNSDSAGGDGGGLFAFKTCSNLSYTSSLSSTTVSGNHATGNGATGGAGAGLYVLGALTVTGGSIANNVATRDGGGLYLGMGSGDGVTLSGGTTVSGNTAARNGGGIYAAGSQTGAAATLTLNNATISGNTANVGNTYGGTGGGLYQSPSQVTVALLNGGAVSGNSCTSCSTAWTDRAGWDYPGPTAKDDAVSDTVEDTVLYVAYTTLKANDVPAWSDATRSRLSISAVSAPNHGTVALDNANSRVVFTPTADYYGAANFTYTLRDTSTGGTSTAVASFNVTAVADIPTAGDVTTAEDNFVTIAVTPNSVDNGAVTHFQAASVTGGTLYKSDGTTVVAAGSYVTVAEGAVLKFKPSADANSPGTTFGVSFKAAFSASGTGLSAARNVTITVTAVNDAPVATADTLSAVAEGTATVTINASTLLANDSAGPANESGQTLTITGVGSAVGGTVSLSGGLITFTPTVHFNGTASFSYTVQDNGTTNGASDPKSATGSVSFSITTVNDTPVAADDTLSTAQEDAAPVVIPTGVLLANDSAGLGGDESGQTIAVVAVSNPVGGTVSLSGTLITFTLAANFNGTASFNYAIVDNGTTNGVSDPKGAGASASFTVTGVNDPPTLGTPTVSGTAVVGQTLTAGASASDVEGNTVTLTYQWQRSTDDVTYANIGGATGSTLVLTSADAHKYVRVMVTANDGQASNNTAMAHSAGTLLANHAPTFTGTPGVSGTAAMGQTLSAAGTGTSDADGDIVTLSYQWQRSSDNVTYSSIGGATGGSYTTTNSDAHKYLRVVVTANDGQASNNTVSATTAGVQLANNAPTFTGTPGVSGTAAVGHTLGVANTGTSDSDGDSVTLSYQWQRSPDDVTYANIGGATGSTFVLTSADAHKYVRVIVTGNDGQAGNNTVSATTAGVQLANGAPTFTGTPSVSGTAAVGQILSAANTGTTDPDGDTVTLSYQWQRSSDNVTYSNIGGAAGSSYTVTGSDTHTYLRVVVTGNDGQASNNTVSATTAGVQLANNAPTLSGTPAVSGTARVGHALSTVNPGTADADGDTVTVSYQWQRSSDNVTYSDIATATGTSYVLTAAEAHKYVRCQLTADDGQTTNHSTTGNSAGQVVANTAPVAGDDSTSVDAATAINIAVISNDADVDGDTLTVSSVPAATANGATLVNHSTYVTYTGASGWNGTDSFTYTVSDGHGGTATASVSVEVFGSIHLSDGNGDPIAGSVSVNSGESYTVTLSGGSGSFTASVLRPDGTTGSLSVAAGTFSLAVPTRGAFAGTYTITITDSVTGDSTEVTVTVPLKVDAERPLLLARDPLRNDMVVRVRGAAADAVVALTADNAAITAGVTLAPLNGGVADAGNEDEGYPASFTLAVPDDLAAALNVELAAQTGALDGSGNVAAAPPTVHSGKVYGPSGEYVVGATVTLNTTIGGDTQPWSDLIGRITATTDATGGFTLLAPPLAGGESHSVQVTADGYAAVSADAATCTEASPCLLAMTAETDAAAPTFSPAGGRYVKSVTVTIESTTTGATLRYTLDGSTPSLSNGIEAGNGTAVVINASSTLRVIAYKPGLNASAVSEATYEITPANGSKNSLGLGAFGMEALALIGLAALRRRWWGSRSGR